MYLLCALKQTIYLKDKTKESSMSKYPKGMLRINVLIFSQLKKITGHNELIITFASKFVL